MATATTSRSGAGGGIAATQALTARPNKIDSGTILGELRKVYTSLCPRGCATLPVSAFKGYLSDTQKVATYDEHSGNEGDAKETGVQKLVHNVFGHSSQAASAEKLLSDDKDLTFDEFVSYHAAPTNSALALPDPRKKDWSRPLNEYFISSSHNTYLTGHQLYGSSTTEGYISVLRRGCRCIEIDVWDGDDGEPEVFHGYTLTKEISFRDVCKAVAKHAFSEGGSPWQGGAGEGPIIISLECHAGPEQQEKIVKIMREQWGDMLVQGIEPEDVENLPSPLELRRKIIVKAKYLPPPPPKATHVDLTAPRVPSPAVADSSSSESSDSELEEMAKKANKQKPPRAKVTRALAALGIYCSSHHFPSHAAQPFTEEPTSRIPNHVYSFSEKLPDASLPLRPPFFVLKRGPHEFWQRGVQLVALNWQKCDEGMMLNEGMFAGEGGYVLKPESYRPGGKGIHEDKRSLDLTIETIAAANIPLPEKSDSPKRFEPYVKIEVHTEAATGLKKKTKAKRGIECAWNEKLEFKGIAGIVEKLTFVRFKIHDEEFGRDDLAAWACIRLDRLQEGYRFVNLINNEGEPSDGLILVKISKRVY
ncbi:PLC-like phosphodiesterase [Tuber magnatum]|uniref:Phosphoinositide phospholipase C n=1 Tax=Tuber magnatum TaxID=42249 RepID=A0A317SXQ1_9PEZI|nr:PLC-like phosphodiesterase [Tuber magnatum]